MKLGPSLYQLMVLMTQERRRWIQWIHFFSKSGVGVENKFNCYVRMCIRTYVRMCTTCGQGADMAEVIFNKIVLFSWNVAFLGHIASACQLTCTYLLTWESGSLFAQDFSRKCYSICLSLPRHILHNTFSKVVSTHAEITGFESEDLAVDVAYKFDKSTKQKCGNATCTQLGLMHTGEWQNLLNCHVVKVPLSN